MEHRTGHGVAVFSRGCPLARASRRLDRGGDRNQPRRSDHRQRRLSAFHELYRHRQYREYRGAPDADGAGERGADRPPGVRGARRPDSTRAFRAAGAARVARQDASGRRLLGAALAMRVLIIDDDEDLRTLLAHYLRQEWPQVEIEQFDPLDREMPDDSFPLGTYDLLILDYQLGRGDGLQWLATFKRRPDCPKVLFLTGAGNEVIAVRAMKAGADDYQRKQELTREKL